MLAGEFDLIPEDINWKDTGCEVHSSCLKCPREKCIEEESRGRQKLRMNARSRQMALLRRQGKNVTEIARLYSVSERTVQRSLSGFYLRDKVRSENG